MVATAKPDQETVMNDLAAHDREIIRSRGDWPSTILEAYKRGRGPYTVRNAYTLLSEESLELYHGWLVWQEMTNAQERRVAAAIQEILSLAARAAGVGQAYPDQFECLMKNGNVLKPDLCVLSDERYAGKVASLKKGTNHYILYGGPELAVEIRSRSNRRSEERKKRRNYFDNNTLEVWDVDYVKQKIWVYGINNPQTPQEYGVGDEIGCEPLLPGWRRPVADFFAPTLSAEQVVGQAAQEWRAESESKGREEGRQRGQLEALRSVLLLQAQARFGTELPSDLAERLERYGVEELTKMATSLATASGLTEWLAGWPS